MKALSLSLLLLCSISASAANKQYPFLCLPGDVLYKNVSECEQNGLLVEGADQCIKLLKTTVQIVNADLKKSMTAMQNNLNRSNGQNKSMGTSEQDYNNALNRFSLLSISGSMLTKQVHGYLDYLTWPEDADEPAITKGDLFAFLKSSPCYNNSRKAITRYEKLLQAMTNQLKAAEAVTNQLKIVTANNKVDVTNATPTTTVLQSQPAANPSYQDEALTGINMGGSGISGPSALTNKK